MHFSLLILSALLSLAIATPFPQNLLFEDEPSVEDPAPFNLPSSPDLFAYADTSSSSSIQQSPQIFNLEGNKPTPYSSALVNSSPSLSPNSCSDGGSFYLARENPSCRGAGTYCCAASSHIQDESRTDCRACTIALKPPSVAT